MAFAYARDDYIYEVVSHHDKSKVGTHIVVNKPAEARKIVMSLDHYNRSNDDGVDIEEYLINIKAGDIDSYPIYSQMRQRFPLPARI